MSRKQRKDTVRSTRVKGRNASGRKLPVADPPQCLVLVLTCVLLVLLAGLSVWEMAGDSVTFDERIRLPAGYAYWKKQDFRLDADNPPLVKFLAAAPLLAMNLQTPSMEPESPDKYQDDYWASTARGWAFGSKFLFSQDTDRIIFWGRLPLVGLALLLGLLVFSWSRQLHGHPGAGLLSLFLLALEPTILAHSHYVTTDVALAAFSIMATHFLWRFSREGKFHHLALASLGLGLALASKFSAIFLVPVFFLLLWLYWPAQGSAMVNFFAQYRSVKARILASAWAALLAAVTVQACYLFSPDLSLYFKGLRTVGANIVPNFLVYVHGNFVPGGVWWYSLYAFLLKTPLPTMITIIVAGLCYAKHRDHSPRSLVFLLLPVAVFITVCTFAGNFGVRYMIPATAFLLVLAGRSYHAFTASRRSKILAGVVAAWLLVSVLRVSPHYISYFNELIGGPENAPYYLDDSNVDWGQDLKRLMQYLKKNQIKEVFISYWGPTPPEHYASEYGVRTIQMTPEMASSENPQPGVYAISVNWLVRARSETSRLNEDPRIDWLGRFKPTGRIGYSIYIYKFPEGRG